MNQPPDMPPEGNESPPPFDRSLVKHLSRLGKIDDKPFFRLVWGQSAETKRFIYNDWFLKYRQFVSRETALAEPIYGLDGKLTGFGKPYRINEVLPAKILQPVQIVKEVGTPRYFIEMLEYFSREDWELNGTEMGAYPEGGLDYGYAIWCCCEHDNCCSHVSVHTNIGYQEDGTTCYGFRRMPISADIANIEQRLRVFEKERRGGTDLRAGWSDTMKDCELAAGESVRAINEFWRKKEADLEGDIYQEVVAHRNRLTGDGHGLDLNTYKDMGARPAMPGTDLSRPLVTEK